jgi:hypothetical protein
LVRLVGRRVLGVLVRRFRDGEVEDLRGGVLGTIILIGEMEEEMTPLLADEEAPATEKLESRMGKAASQWG